MTPPRPEVRPERGEDVDHQWYGGWTGDGRCLPRALGPENWVDKGGPGGGTWRKSSSPLSG